MKITYDTQFYELGPCFIMEINRHLAIVLKGLQKQMMGAHEGGTGMNNKSKGAVREQFIKGVRVGMKPYTPTTSSETVCGESP